jgi:hypothetical protein
MTPYGADGAGALNRGPLRPPGVRDDETLVSGRDLPLKAGHRSSIAGEKLPNETGLGPMFAVGSPLMALRIGCGKA